MQILMSALIALHALLAIVLILLVLLHRGQGGGMSDMFGGGAVGGAQGSAIVEKNLDRFTVIASVSFGITNCLLVAFL